MERARLWSAWRGKHGGHASGAELIQRPIQCRARHSTLRPTGNLGAITGRSNFSAVPSPVMIAPKVESAFESKPTAALGNDFSSTCRPVIDWSNHPRSIRELLLPESLQVPGIEIDFSAHARRGLYYCGVVADSNGQNE